MTVGALPVIAAGMAAGTGITMAVSALRPAPARLDAALARLQAAEPAAPRTGGLEAAAGHWLAAQLARTASLALPRTDLALLGRTPESFALRKLAAGLAGLVSFALAGAVLAAAGLGVPWQAPVAMSLAAGAGMFFVPDIDLRADARRRRRDFRYAFGAYLQLVRLARTAGAATSEALESAAAQGTGWAFAHIQGALDSARTAHQPLWQGLADLGQRIGSDDVRELAGIIQEAGAEGTRIADTLAAAAESLQRQLATDTRAQANSRTTAMIVPVTLLGLGFIVLMAYPFAAALLATTP